MVDLLVILAVSLSLSLGLALLAFRVVRIRQALLICDRATGEALGIVVGPRLTSLIPFVETAILLDLKMRSLRLLPDGIVLSDGLRLQSDVEVFWRLDPELLKAAQIDLLVPLLDDMETSVRPWIHYALCKTLEGFSLSEVMQAHRRNLDLERMLLEYLDEVLSPLGVKVDAVRLICQPDPSIVSSRVAAEARSQALATLAAALGSADNYEKLYRLEMLETMRSSGAHIVTTVDMAGAPSNGNGRGGIQFVVGPDS